MWCGCNQENVAIRGFRDLLDEFVTELTASAFAPCRRATVSFVHDDKLGALEREVVATTLALDEIGGDDYERMPIKNGHTKRQIAFEPLDCAAKNQLPFDVKLGGEFFLPLLGEMGRTENRDTFDFAPVEEFAGDEASLHGFADAHIVGDE